MDNRRTQELKWHCGILERNEHCYLDLIDAYITSIVDHVLNGFGNYLKHDLKLAHEAAWLAFQHYFAHPRQYQPAKGSLRYFLEIHAVRKMQQLLQEENRCWHFQHLHFVLARYFDNEQDMKIAKLLVRQEKNWCEFARILDIGAMPIELQLKEIKRNVCRIEKTIEASGIDFSTMANKRIFVKAVQVGIKKQQASSTAMN